MESVLDKGQNWVRIKQQSHRISEPVTTENKRDIMDIIWILYLDSVKGSKFPLYLWHVKDA